MHALGRANLTTVLPALLLLPISSCALSSSTAVGPTIYSDGHPGVEGNITAGAGPAFLDSPATQDRSINLFILGASLSLGAELSHPHVPVGLTAFFEFSRVGSPSSPFGFHARLGTGYGLWQGGGLPLALTLGPQWTTAQNHVSPDGCGARRYTRGVDFQARRLFHAPILADCPECKGRWQYGLLYAQTYSDYLDLCMKPPQSSP
jgi:hypothetical protein